MARLAAPALVALSLGCAADGPPELSLRMMARDGEDPLAGATSLRLDLEADPPIDLEPVAIDPEGFDVEIDLPSVTALRRVRLTLADEAGAVVSRGATPDAPLELLTGVPVRVLMSRPGTAAPVTLAGWPALEAAAPLESEWVLGLDASGAVGMLDLLALAPVAGVAPLTPARPGARLADLGEARTLVIGGGEGVRIYDGLTNLWGEGGDGIDDGSFVTPVVLGLEGGGALAACGGRREVVGFAVDGTVAWTAELSAARTGCAATVAGSVLVVYGGGDDEGAPAAEAVDLIEHTVRTLVAEPDPRQGAAAAAAGTRVLILGGAVAGEARDDGLRLDPACADGCPEPLTLGAARAPAVACSLEDGRVLLAGGGEPLEVVSGEDGNTEPVSGPASEATLLFRTGTDDVWWWGPDGSGVYAE